MEIAAGALPCERDWGNSAKSTVDRCNETAFRRGGENVVRVGQRTKCTRGDRRVDNAFVELAVVREKAMGGKLADKISLFLWRPRLLPGKRGIQREIAKVTL